MKILIFSCGFIDYTIGLANSLSAKHEVRLCLPKNSIEDRYDETINDKIDFISFDMPRHRSLHNIFLMRRIYKLIKAFNPEIIHLQSEGHLYFSILHPLLKDCKILNTVHDPKTHPGEKENFIVKLLERFNSFFIDEYIVHGDNLKSELSKSRNIDYKKISIINHGDYNLYHHWSKKKTKKETDTILFFGRIWKYKGLDYLIRAQPIISKYMPNAKIIIAGRGENIKKYTRQIKDLNKYEIYNYRISNEQTASLFERSSLVVLPYIEGSQSGIIHLAYSFGKPVVATRVGSLHENIYNFKSGILVDPKDYRQLAASIIVLLRNKKQLNKMSLFARNLSLNEYSWNTLSDKTANLYNEVLKR